MKDTEVTRVVFRVWKGKDGGVLALFPDLEHNNYLCESYEHVGQHGGANYRQCISNTRRATPEEYEPLRRELTNIGYNLRICERR